MKLHLLWRKWCSVCLTLTTKSPGSASSAPLTAQFSGVRILFLRPRDGLWQALLCGHFHLYQTVSSSLSSGYLWPFLLRPSPLPLMRPTWLVLWSKLLLIALLHIADLVLRPQCPQCPLWLWLRLTSPTLVPCRWSTPAPQALDPLVLLQICVQALRIKVL